MPYSNSRIRGLVEDRITTINDRIRELRAEEQELRAELAGLDRPETTTTPPPTPVGVAELEQYEEGLPYAFLKPQKAVLRFLQDNPGPRPHTSKEIHDALLAGGMVTTAKNTREAVATALNRQNGKTVRRVADGRWQALFPSP